MRSALTLGSLGVLLVFFLGLGQLEWSVVDCLWTVGVTLISGFFSPLIVLQGERVGALKRTLFRNGMTTWILFVSLFLGLIWIMGPESLRSGKAMLWMFVPLSFTTGFSIIAFGPVQDRLVSARQKRRS